MGKPTINPHLKIAKLAIEQENKKTGPAAAAEILCPHRMT